MNCPQCQTPAPSGARFCGQCGGKLTRSCPHCQHDNQAGSLYCEACGKSLSASRGTQGLGELGDRRIITVLFTDVSGFTAMSEKLDPEAVTAIVNRFFTVLTRPIYQYGGVVDKYIGDAIMALFGAPVAHEDDPERALAAAWAMQVAAREFADNLEAKTGIRLRIRIGLHTGLVIAGAVGGDQKRDYTVLGETVNIASRMEQGARPGAILVSEETYRLTTHGWDFVELDPVSIKGRSRAIRVYEPRGPRAPITEEPREHPEFVGRAYELSRLASAAQSTLEGSPQLVSLVGDAGIGKSRLVREFLRRLTEDHPWRVLRARCLSYQKDISYSLVASLLSHWLGIDLDAVTHSHLEAWCREHGSQDPARDAELLGYFLSLPVRAADLKQLNPEALRNLATQRSFDLIVTPGAPPTALSLVDLHWADDASRQWLLSLIRTAARVVDYPVPLLILAQVRPEGDEILPDDLGMSALRMHVRALSAEDGEALIRAFLELSGPVEQQGFRAVLEEALAKAEGNPFYLCELIRSLTEAGVIGRVGDTWRIEPTRGKVTLPSTIHGVVVARIDRLSASAKQALQVASVLGREFARSLLTEVSQADEMGLVLQELVSADLVHPRAHHPGLYAFNQALIQEVAYHGILVKVRRELHRRVGTLIAEKDAYQPAEHAQLLAYHFTLAEDRPKALLYLYLAGKHGMAMFENAGAKAALTQSLELRAQVSLEVAPEPTWEALLTTLASVEATLGHYQEALAHLESALPHATTGSARAAIHRQRGAVFERLGQYEQALATYQTGQTELAGERGTDAQRSGLVAATAYVEYGLGQYDRAIAHCQEAMLALTAPEHRKDLSFCHSVAGLCWLKLGRCTEALDQHAKALELRQAIEDLLGVGASSNNMAQVYYELGDLARSRQMMEKAIAAFQRVGDQSWIAIGYNNVGALLLDQDDLPGAEKAFSEGLAICQRIGFASRLAMNRCNLGEVYAKQGRHPEALAILKEAIASLEALNSNEVLAGAYSQLATVHLALGAHREAWEAIVKGLRVTKVTGDDAFRGVYYSLAGALYSALGQPKQAVAWCSRAITLLQSLNSNLELGRAWMRLAQVLFADGQRTHAAAATMRARDLFKEVDARYDLRMLKTWLAEHQPARPTVHQEAR